MTAVEITDKELSLLLLHQLEPWSGYDNLPIAIEISGRLRWWPLQEAVNGLLRRHAALRTVFSANGEEFHKTVLAPEAIEVEVETHPGTAGLGEFVDRPFALDGRPLIRVGLFRDETTDTLCVTVHHLVFDAMSAYIVVDELVAMYERLCQHDVLPPEMTAPVPRLPEAPPSGASKAYWHRQLDGAPMGSARMPFSPWEPSDRRSAGANLARALPDDVRHAAERLRRDLRVTDNIVFMAAFYALLTRHGAGTDLVIGVPVNMRDARHGNSVGYHANTIPLRAIVDRSQGFGSLAHRVRDTLLTGLAHADVTVDSLGTVRGSTAEAWRHGPFRYLFNYPPVVANESRSVDGMPARSALAITRASRYDLELFVLVGGSGSRVRAIYNTAAHTAAEIEHLIDRYFMLLRSAAEAPTAAIDTLPMERLPAETPIVVDETGQPLPTGLWGRLCGNDSGTLARIAWDGTIEHADSRATTPDDPGSAAPGHDQPDDTHLATVLALWREVLGQPDLDPDTDFFAAGGQSLLAVRLLQRTGRRFGLRIPLETLTAAPTPRTFATRLAGQVPASRAQRG